MANKRVICKSGIGGWQGKLQEQYNCFEEFKSYSDIYGLASRLGYTSSKEAWKKNPLIRGSVVPSDYEIASPQ